MMLNHTMTQYHVNRGLKVFGEQGEAAVLAELQQLHVQDVIEPMCAHELSEADCADALPYLIFLKQKQTGIKKGLGCADVGSSAYT